MWWGDGSFGSAALLLALVEIAMFQLLPWPLPRRRIDRMKDGDPSRIELDAALRGLGFTRPRRGRVLSGLTFDDLEDIMLEGWQRGRAAQMDVAAVVPEVRLAGWTEQP